MTIGRAHEFMLTFGSATELRRAVRLKGTERGLFFQSDRDVSAGDPVLIRAHVQGLRSGLWLEGRVAWRRVQSTRALIPTGIFVGLTLRSLGLVDDVVRHMTSALEQAERRGHARLFVLLDAIYRAGDAMFPAEIRNLSEGGAFLRCQDVPPVPGSEVFVTLLPGHGVRRGRRFPAEVAWSEASEDFRSMGVQFRPAWLVRWRLARTLDRIQRTRGPLAYGRRPW
jgi:hypothetical protein